MKRAKVAPKPELPAVVERIWKGADMSKYNPKHDGEKCACGHPYARHFDTYDGMKPAGCKYCPCPGFQKEPAPTQPKPGLERVLAAYGAGGEPVLMAVKGRAVEREVDALDWQDAAEPIAYVEGKASCLLVLDIKPFWCSGPYECPADGEMDFSNAEERAPTEAEWRFIQAGDMDGLKAHWTDVLSWREAEEAEKARKEGSSGISVGDDLASASLVGWKG